MTREEAIKIIDCYDIGFYDLSGEKIPADKLADAFDMAIEALQGDMYCPNCGVRLVPENEYLEPTHTHGRLIDADALLEAVDRIGLTCDGGVDINDLEGTIQEMADADRPHGEWIEREDWNGDSYYDCSVCGESFVLCDGTPSMNLYHYCPNCGCAMDDMRGGK